MTIIDSILAKIGLMRVEDHKAETHRLNLELAKQGNALSEAKAEVRKATDDLAKLVKNYGTRGDLLAMARKKRAQAETMFNKAAKDLEQQSVEISRLTRGWKKVNADILLLRRQLDDSEAELAKLRPDAEKWRARLRRDRERRKRGAA